MCHFLCITESFSFSLIICLGFFVLFCFVLFCGYIALIIEFLKVQAGTKKHLIYLFILVFYFTLVLLKNNWQISLYTFKACGLMVWCAQVISDVDPANIHPLI